MSKQKFSKVKHPNKNWLFYYTLLLSEHMSKQKFCKVKHPNKKLFNYTLLLSEHMNKQKFCKVKLNYPNKKTTI